MVEAYEVQSTLSVRDELNAALAKAIAQARALDRVLRDVREASNGAFRRPNITRSAPSIDQLVDPAPRPRRARGASSPVGATLPDERPIRAPARSALVTSNVVPIASVAPSSAPRPITSAVSRINVDNRPAGPQISPWKPAGMPTGIPTAANRNTRPSETLDIPQPPPGANRNYWPAGAGGGSGVPPTGSFPLGAGGAGGGGNGHLNSTIDAYILTQAGEIGTRFGEGMLAALGKTLAAGGDLQHQQTLISLLLGTPTTPSQVAAKQANMQIAENAAYGTSMALPQTSLTSNTAAVRDLYTILGSMPEAAKMLTPMQSYSIVSGALAPNRKADPYLAVRSGEMLGYTVNPTTGNIDPQRMQTFLNILERAELATGGHVDERQFFNFAQQASLAAKNMTAQGLMMMVPVINELGGARAGTALQSINQQIVGGVMPQRIVADWEKLTGANGKPLLDPTKVTATRTGVRAGPGAIQGSDLLQQNPIAWIETNLIPAMTKAGMTRAQMVPEIMRLFSRSTSQREAGVIATQMLQIQKDYGVEMAAMPTEQAVASLTGGDFQTNLAAMTGAWTNFETVLGKTMLPVVIPAIQGITRGILALTNAVTAHPEMAKVLLATGAALGGLAIAGGSALVTIGALRLALEGIAGLRGGLGLASAVQTAGIDGALGGLAAVASPIGAAIAVGFLAYIGGKGLNALIEGSAPPNTGAPRTGYHPANEHKPSPVILPQLKALPPAPDGVRHDGVGRGVNTELHRAAVALQHAASALSKGPGTVTINLDGKKVAEVVVGHMTDTMKRPNRGKSSFDNRNTPALPSHAIALRG